MKKILLSLIAIGAMNIASAQIPNLVARYHLDGNFDEADGGTPLTGTLSNYQFTTDKFNNTSSALLMDTATPFGLAISNPALCTEEFTVSFFVKINGFGYSSSFNSIIPLFMVNKGISDYFERVMIGYTTSKMGVRWAHTGSSVTSKIDYTYDTNRWYHIVMTHSADAAHFYVDGTWEFGISKSSTLPCNSSNNATLGNLNHNSSVAKAKCVLDELSLYDRVLSDEEIMNLHYLEFLNFDGELSIDQAQQSNINLAPNPSNTTITLQGEKMMDLYQSLQIIDVTGRQQMTTPISSNHIIIPVEHLQTGIYFAQLKGKTLQTIRFEVR